MSSVLDKVMRLYSENLTEIMQAGNYEKNLQFFYLVLRSIGLSNWENPVISGETWFLHTLLRGRERPVVFDVGANVGGYAALALSANPLATVYAFEPHPVTFAQLKKKARERGFLALNVGCSDKPSRTEIFDYKNCNGSQHASLYHEVIEEMFHSESAPTSIRLIDLDSFIESEGIKHIDLLKVDTEGHELPVLRGAERAIRNKVVETIHFEFNKMNIISRTFFRDIYQFLDGFAFFRMLPDGLAPLGDYFPALYELYGFQNIAAIRKEALVRAAAA